MKVAIMASGRGSNFQAILEASKKGDLPSVKIKCLIVNKPDAYAIEIAKKNNIPYIIVESKNKKRETFDKELLDVLKKNEIEIIALAGFMRILTPTFIQTYKNRIINIHPSLLPSFPGAHAHRDAIKAGAKNSGCTVHLVDEGVDTGPILMQESIPIEIDDDEESLAKKILPLEHKIFPIAIELLCSNNIEINGRDANIKTD